MDTHEIKGTNPTLLLRPLVWTGVFPLNNSLRECITKNNLKDLARRMQMRKVNIEDPIRVTYHYGFEDVRFRWRTPLELAIEKTGVQDATMVVFLLEKGARITQPAMLLALNAARQSVRASDQLDAGGEFLPSGQTDAGGELLLKILSAAGAQWGELLTGEDKPAQQARVCLEAIFNGAPTWQLEALGLPRVDDPKFTRPEEFLARLGQEHLESSTAQAAGLSSPKTRL